MAPFVFKMNTEEAGPYVYEFVKDIMDARFDEDEHTEDEVDEWIEESLNNMTVSDIALEINNVDNNIWDKEDFIYTDMIDMIRYICKYYEEEFGTAYEPHKNTDHQIVNLFTYLCAREMRDKFITKNNVIREI